MLPCCCVACGVHLRLLVGVFCCVIHVSACSRLGCVGPLHGGAPYLNMAKYVVSSLLRPDGTVQTTSQVTLDHLPNFTKHNVQAHSSSRDVQALSSSTNVRAVRNHAIGRHSRSPVSRRSRVKLTPGPQGMSEDEEDWGEWKGDGRRAHDDERRPRSPSLPPAHLRLPVNQIELLHLPVCQQVPALGSHRFTLRSGCRIEEIAILIDDVLYYTLPCHLSVS